MTEPVEGYAVRSKDRIIPETVGPTIRAAMVNGLYLNGVITPAIADDEWIRTVWRINARKHGFEIVLVSIACNGPVNVLRCAIA